MIAMLVLVSVFVAAEQPPMTLVQVQLAGSARFKAEHVTSLAGLTVGKPVSVAELDAAAQRLANTGFFENVTYRYNAAGGKATVTYTIVEAPWTIPVVFDNFAPVPDAEIAAAVQPDVPTFDFTLPAAEELPDRVLKALARMMKTREIAGRAVFTPHKDMRTGKLQYVFSVADPSPVLCDVQFEGITAGPGTEVRDAVRSLTGSAYSRVSTRAVIDGTLSDLYRRHGYWRAGFDGPRETAVRNGCSGIAVTVAVTEGPAYVWDGAVWSGNSAIDGTELDRLLGLSRGALAARDRIEDGLRGVRGAYGRKGHVMAHATYTPRLDDASKKAVFEMRVVEGPQFRMGTLQFEGIAEKDTERLRERWRLKPGDVFDQGYLAEFQSKELGMLRSASGRRPMLQSRVDTQRQVVDVKIVLQ